MKKEEILKVIGQLQYEISILDIDEERLTGVDIRTEELKNLVNNVVLDDVNEPFYCDIIEGEEGYRCKEQCMSCRSIEDKLTKQ